MGWDGYATTLFRALKKQNGKVVCVDIEHLAQTTLVVRSGDEYQRALRQGWIDGTPDDAMEAFELEEQKVSNAAAEHAYGVLKMSEPAQREVEAYEKTTPQHVPEMPEAPKKRGRPKKVTSDAG